MKNVSRARHDSLQVIDSFINTSFDFIQTKILWMYKGQITHFTFSILLKTSIEGFQYPLITVIPPFGVITLLSLWSLDTCNIVVRALFAILFSLPPLIIHIHFSYNSTLYICLPWLIPKCFKSKSDRIPSLAKCDNLTGVIRKT